MSLICVGNALVDVLIKIKDDSLLEQFAMKKGSMQLIDRVFKDRIHRAASSLEQFVVSGGSAANTAHGTASLGLETGYIGKTGKDRYGYFYQKDLMKNGINPVLLEGTTDTGVATALVSPDAERTFGTYLGSAVELSAEDLKPEMFENYSTMHIEGYLVQNHELIETAMKFAKEQGCKISIDMASFNVVSENLEFLQSLLEKYVDIVFANEQEAQALTQEKPEEALKRIAEICEIAVVKIGKRGSLIRRGDEQASVTPYPADIVDTTGAGDLYAAGFIYALSQNLSLEQAGQIGSLLASEVISVMGAKIPDDRWPSIREQIGEISE